MALCVVSQDQLAGTPAAASGSGFRELTSEDTAERTKQLSAELANGRQAVMVIIGVFFQDGMTGSARGDRFSYTASTLRAFGSELGAQAPVGFLNLQDSRPTAEWRPSSVALRWSSSMAAS
jgi:hypothetical protein